MGKARDGVLSGQTILIGHIFEWVSSRHLPFSVRDLMGGLELGRDQARRYMNSLIVLGWIETTGEFQEIEGKEHRAATYRSNRRIRRINASASVGERSR
jgi:hypothetical protein